MSMRFIDSRLIFNIAAAALLLTGCSAPMPVPSSAPPPPAKEETTPPPPAASTAPQQPDAALQKQFAAGVAAMKAGRDKQAAEVFSTIVKQKPRLAGPHTNLGILLYRQGRLTEAEAAFKEALKCNTQAYVAANYLGMIYRKLGRFDEARAAYQQALDAKSDYAYAHLNMAILYDLYLGDLDKALDHYQQYQQDDGEKDQQLAGWLADLRQRIKETGGTATP